jgi:hypothetical protein
MTKYFLFSTASRPALGLIQPPIQWVPGLFSLEVTWLECEADHSPPSSAEVINKWSYTSTPQSIFMAWCLVKHRGKFTFFTFMGYIYWTSEARVILLKLGFKRFINMFCCIGCIVCACPLYGMLLSEWQWTISVKCKSVNTGTRVWFNYTFSVWLS